MVIENNTLAVECLPTGIVVVSWCLKSEKICKVAFLLPGLYPLGPINLLLFNCIFTIVLDFVKQPSQNILFYSELSPGELIDPVCEALHKCYGIMGMQRSGPALGLVQPLHL